MQQSTIVTISYDEMENLLISTLKSVLDARSQELPSAKDIPAQIVNGKKLADILGVSMPTIINWRKRGKIPFLSIGEAIRYDLNKVLKALEDRIIQK